MAVGFNPIPQKTEIQLGFQLYPLGTSWEMFALANMDNKLFLEREGCWTADFKLADMFSDLEAVRAKAFQNGVKNAAAIILEGDPLTATAIFWIARPN